MVSLELKSPHNAIDSSAHHPSHLNKFVSIQLAKLCRLFEDQTALSTNYFDGNISKNRTNSIVTGTLITLSCQCCTVKLNAGRLLILEVTVFCIYNSISNYSRASMFQRLMLMNNMFALQL